MTAKLFITIFAGFAFMAPAAEYDENKSKQVAITFAISNAGFDVTGTIDVLAADLRFDPRDLQNSSVTVVASASTITTGIGLRDRHLQKDDFFSTDRYPAITMQSKSFRKVSKGQIAGSFDLTIKGITRPVEVTLLAAPEGESGWYSAHFEISRLDFSIGEKSMILDDRVRVDVVVRR